jgi:hypothetical protein
MSLRLHHGRGSRRQRTLPRSPEVHGRGWMHGTSKLFKLMSNDMQKILKLNADNDFQMRNRSF